MERMNIVQFKHHSQIPDEILDMLERVNNEERVLPPTILFNEGWMLRLVLAAQHRGINCLPFSFLAGSRWFSEAQLRSKFHPRFRGDRVAETRTHVDGVVGHFRLLPGTKTDLELVAGAKQFVVIEAKMFSPLTSYTRYAICYDQVARTVACMATTLEHADILPSDLTSVGFYVIAPSSQIELGVFSKQMNRVHIAEKVQLRIKDYQDNNEHFTKLQVWFKDFLTPLLERIDLRCWAWEKTIDEILSADLERGSIIQEFYRSCIKYNPTMDPRMYTLSRKHRGVNS